jgi:hypothetical protein
MLPTLDRSSYEYLLAFHPLNKVLTLACAVEQLREMNADVANAAISAAATDVFDGPTIITTIAPIARRAGSVFETNEPPTLSRTLAPIRRVA